MAWVIGLVGGVAQAAGNSRAGHAEKVRGSREAHKEGLQKQSMEAMKRDEIRKTVGTQQANYAASGVSSDSGSVMEVIADTYYSGGADIANIRSGNMSADLLLYARNRAEARNYESAGSLLTSFANAAKAYKG